MDVLALYFIRGVQWIVCSPVVCTFDEWVCCFVYLDSDLCLNVLESLGLDKARMA